MSADAIWEPALIESAKSSLIFEFIEREKSIDNVVLQNFISACFRGTNRITDINQKNIRQINEVTIEDMVSVGKEYINKLFTIESRTTIVCHPDKANEIRDEFKEYVQYFLSFCFGANLIYFRLVFLHFRFGFHMTVSTNIENSILGQDDA